MRNYFLLPVFIMILGAYGVYLCNMSEKRHKNAYDERFIPYDIQSFDVWVYNDNTDKEYYAGSVAADYSGAKERLCVAQSLAYDFAEGRHLKDWSYVCCTVTSTSNCVTKVR